MLASTKMRESSTRRCIAADRSELEDDGLSYSDPLVAQWKKVWGLMSPRILSLGKRIYPTHLGKLG